MPQPPRPNPTNGVPAIRPGMPHRVLASGESRAEMVRQLAGRAVAVSVQTAGTEPWQPGARLRMVVLAAGPGMAWIDLAPGDAVAEILSRAPVLIGHKVFRDLLWLDAFGVVRLEDAEDRAFDTLPLAHLKDNRTSLRRHFSDAQDEWDEATLVDVVPEEEVPGHALQDLGAHYLGPDADVARRRLWDAHNLPDEGSAEFGFAWTSIDDSDPLLLDYAAGQVDLVCLLLPHLKPRRAEEPLVDLERRVAASAARMTRRGFLVDERQVAAARGRCFAELAETVPQLRARGVEFLGATGRGRDQAVRALAAEGAPLTKRTPSGAVSLDREVLDGLVVAGYPLAGQIRRARRAERDCRDYLDKMLANQSADGRLRPSIHTLGTRTGRWSVSGALPMQQLPSVGGIRECLTADPGRVLVSFDYTAIEFTTLAAITGDPRMLAVVRSGEDPHIAAAEVIWPGTMALRDDDPERLRRRQQAKAFTYGLGYGMGAETLAVRSGLPLHEARRARDQLRQAWPGGQFLMETVGYRFRQGDRFLESPFHRRYRIPERDDRPVQHQALNNLNQGAARDLMMRDLLGLVDRGLEPWFTVHDEIIVECDAEDATAVAMHMREVMSCDRHEVLDVPVRVDGGVLGHAWTKSAPE
jgi:DNA polymerase I-like protein with 3'-5' exonuclease and polymerase domains